MLAGIFCIFLNFVGVGIFSINKNTFGFMHEFFTGVSFGGFILWSFIIGWCVILCSSKVPKKLGWYGVIGSLTTLILFWIFKNPLWEWFLLFSILAFVIPMGIFTLKQPRLP